jgi:gamma-glutamyl-gamma-aminobutyrate hydrolase PuuD
MSAAPTICINMDCKPDEAKVPAYSVKIGYVDCVVAAGGVPLLAPCVADDRTRDEFVARADGFLFIGGADWPPALYGAEPHPKTKLQNEQRVRADDYLVRAALDGDKPVLGICAGHQLLHIARGGSLVQHLDAADDHVAPAEHDIAIVPGSRLERICGATTVRVNSRHHQAIDGRTLHESFTVTARAPDGVIEGIEMAGDRFVVGVQWHPEYMKRAGQLMDPATTGSLFRHFVDAARDHASARDAAS